MSGHKSHEPSVEQWIERLKPKVAELKKHKEPLRDFVTDDAANTFGWDDASSPLITRRVFVSSTFRDFHTERDLLQRKVAPVLRERCAQHGETFDLVDLRWGVATSDLGPEEAAEKVASVCFKLIDNCEPYFLCLVGERYGWIPEQEVWERALGKEMAGRLAKEALELCGTENLSATSAEVAYGVSHAPKSGRAMRVMGALRDPIKVTCVTDRTSVYVDDGHAEYVHELRDGLRRVCGEDLICYSGRLDEESGRLEDLITDDGENLEDALIKLIEKTFEEDWSRERARGAYDRVWSQNRAFVKSRVDSEYVVHRSELVAHALEYADRNSEPLCICAGQGEGKTQLLCELFRRYEDQSGTVVAGFFPEASSSQLSINAVLDYVLASVRIGHGLSPVAANLPKPNDVGGINPSEWANLLDEAAREYEGTKNEAKRIVVIIDSSDGIDGLLGYVAKVFASVGKKKGTKNSPVFIKAILSVDSANMDSIEGGIDEFNVGFPSSQELGRIAELELRRNHRDVTKGMKQALCCLGPGKSPLHAILSVRSLVLLGGEDLAELTNSAVIESYVAERCSNLPDGLLELSLSLYEDISNAVGSPLPQMLMEALSFLPYGATRETLRSVIEKAGYAWSDLDVETTISFLAPLIRQGQDGLISIAFEPLRRSVSQMVREGDGQRCRGLLAHLTNRVLATTDGSTSSLANALHLAREANLPHLCLALCHLAVEGSNTDPRLSASSLRSALLSACSVDEGEWFADAIHAAADAGDLTWRDFSFLLWFVKSAPWTRSSDAVITNIGFEILHAYERMKGRMPRIEKLKKARDDAQKAYERVSKRSDPDRWAGLILPLEESHRCRAMLKREGVMKSYIGGNYSWGKFRVGGKVAYDLDVLFGWNSRTARVMHIGYGDAGLAHILNNGFPYRFIQDGGDLDRYITQAAIWWYVDERGISTDFRSRASDMYHIRPAIEKLVSEARAAKQEGDQYLSLSNGILRPCVFATDRWNSSLVVTLADPKDFELEVEAEPRAR